MVGGWNQAEELPPPPFRHVMSHVDKIRRSLLVFLSSHLPFHSPFPTIMPQDWRENVQQLCPNSGGWSMRLLLGIADHLLSSPDEEDSAADDRAVKVRLISCP